MPPPIAARLNREIVEFMATPEVKRALAAQAISLCRLTPSARRVQIATPTITSGPTTSWWGLSQVENNIRNASES